jgi:hypothetical protein
MKAFFSDPGPSTFVTHANYRFIHARDSRAQLSIARKQLLSVLTHLEAMPAFLDHVFTFRRREKPHFQADFSFEDSLSSSYPRCPIKELGRSGMQIQHSFNLVGIESDTKQTIPWLIRQTAVHFSFDVVGGQASWIVLKANGVIRERLEKDIKNDSSNRPPHDLSTPRGSFLLAMRTHLLLLDWGTENWSKYIDYLENRVAWPSALVRGTDMADLTTNEAIGRLADMRSPPQSRNNTGLSQNGPVSRRSSFREFFSLQHRSSSNAAAQNPLAPNSADKTDHLNVDDLFSFDQLQALHRDMSKLEKASDVIKQDRNVMEQIVGRFESLQKSANFSSLLPIDGADFDRFYRRARASIRHLEGQLARLQAIISSLDKVISLFTAILQYSNMKTGEYFAAHAKESTETMEILTKNMHELATKTKKETVSMHFITVLTLFFLPGTFVAVRYWFKLLRSKNNLPSGSLTDSQTFFSTGILEFGEDSPAVSISAGRSLGGWAFRPSALKLFVSICFPLMAFVLCIWILAYIVARREQRELSRGFGVDQNASGSAEKGQSAGRP